MLQNFKAFLVSDTKNFKMAPVCIQSLDTTQVKNEVMRFFFSNCEAYTKLLTWNLWLLLVTSLTVKYRNQAWNWRQHAGNFRTKTPSMANLFLLFYNYLAWKKMFIYLLQEMEKSYTSSEQIQLLYTNTSYAIIKSR